jgi:hypothetical protein
MKVPPTVAASLAIYVALLDRQIGDWVTAELRAGLAATDGRFRSVAAAGRDPRFWWYAQIIPSF